MSLFCRKRRRRNMNDIAKGYLSTIYNFQQLLNDSEKKYMNEIVVKNGDEYELAANFKNLSDEELKHIYIRCREGFRLDRDITRNLRNKIYSHSVKISNFTPEILVELGFDDLPMFYHNRHLQQALSPRDPEHSNINYHNEIKKRDILSIIDAIANSAIIFDDKSGEGIICVTDRIVQKEVTREIMIYGRIEDKKEIREVPIMVSIKPDSDTEYYKENIKSNYITTIFARENIGKMIEDATNRKALLLLDMKKIQSLIPLLSLNAQDMYKFHAFFTRLDRNQERNNMAFKRLARLQSPRYYLSNFESKIILQETRVNVKQNTTQNSNSKKKVKKKGAKSNVKNQASELATVQNHETRKEKEMSTNYDYQYKKSQESRKELVAELIQKMEEGELPWKKPWDIAQNATTGKQYHGGNKLRLMLESMKNNFTDPRFATFLQAKEQGWKIKKGAKGILLEKYIFNEERYKRDENGKIMLDENGEKLKETLEFDPPKVNTFYVYNARDIEGIPQRQMDEMEHTDVLSIADDFIQTSILDGCEVLEGDFDTAAYSPILDNITLPKRGFFQTDVGFLSTMLHEVSHSTMHPSRMNRPAYYKKGEFGSKDYAKEELVAELSATFLQADLHVNQNEVTNKGDYLKNYDNHAAYLKSWISVLKEDHNVLFNAASEAQRVADYIDSKRQRYLANGRDKSIVLNDKIPDYNFMVVEEHKDEDITIVKRGDEYSVEYKLDYNTGLSESSQGGFKTIEDARLYKKSIPSIHDASDRKAKLEAYKQKKMQEAGTQANTNSQGRSR